MTVRGVGWFGLVLAAAALGCHGPARRAETPAPSPTADRQTASLPAADPVPPAFDLAPLPPAGTEPPVPPTSARGLTEPVAQRLAAVNTPAANLLDDENRVHGPASGCAADQTRQEVRRFTALELRNQAAAAALEQFFRLADTECRADILRETLPILDGLRDRAARAKAAGLRFPLDAGDLDRERLDLLARLDQADTGARLLTLDLHRRLGLPAAGERLWPTGVFEIDPDPVDADAAAALALAERPELLAWRALYHGLGPETLPAVREQLRGVNPLAGAVAAGADLPCGVRLLLAVARCLGCTPGPDAATRAEVEVRRKQLAGVIADREGAVAIEARAAAVSLNAQARRLALTRDRAGGLQAAAAEARKKQDANLPGADLTAAQAEMAWRKGRAEVAAEVMAWHVARVRLKAAVGRLAWECAPPGCGRP